MAILSTFGKYFVLQQYIDLMDKRQFKNNYIFNVFVAEINRIVAFLRQRTDVKIFEMIYQDY